MHSFLHVCFACLGSQLERNEVRTGKGGEITASIVGGICGASSHERRCTSICLKLRSLIVHLFALKAAHVEVPSQNTWSSQFPSGFLRFTVFRTVLVVFSFMVVLVTTAYLHAEDCNVIMRSTLVRLEGVNQQLKKLCEQVNLVALRESYYRGNLEKKYSNLQKAEVEVDLLGDEVENLLSLLEKVYVALDHYLPILQHYPGIPELLKLIRRELIAQVDTGLQV